MTMSPANSLAASSAEDGDEVCRDDHQEHAGGQGCLCAGDGAGQRGESSGLVREAVQQRQFQSVLGVVADKVGQWEQDEPAPHGFGYPGQAGRVAGRECAEQRQDSGERDVGGEDQYGVAGPAGCAVPREQGVGAGRRVGGPAVEQVGAPVEVEIAEAAGGAVEHRRDRIDHDEAREQRGERPEDAA
jgi:hypothetical protein